MAKKRSTTDKYLNGISGASNIDVLRKRHELARNNKQIKNLLNIDYDDSNVDKNAISNKDMESNDLRYETELYKNLQLGYDMFSNNLLKQETYFDKSESNRARELVYLAKDDTISEVLSKLSEEVIQFDRGEFVNIRVNTEKAGKLGIKPNVLKKVDDVLQKILPDILRMLSFNRGRAKHFLEMFLIEGKQAFEIVYDNPQNPKKIIDIIEINPYNVKPWFDNGRKYWLHKRENLGRNDTIMVFDHQVNYVTWKDVSPNGRMSYVEGLIRRYNMLRAVENSRILASITASIFRTITKVPTKNKSRRDAATTLANESSRLSERIELNNDTGIVEVNGTSNFGGMRQAFQADGDSGSPTIESIDNTNIQLDDAGLETFTKKYNKATRIPFSRFDEQGSTWNLDATAQLREEISYGNFVDSIRIVWGNLILKPVIVQFLLNNPNFITEERFIDCIELDFVTSNYFREQLKFEVEKSRMEYLRDLIDFASLETPDGQQVPLLSKTLLLKEYMGYTDEYLAAHVKQSKKDIDSIGQSLKAFQDTEERYDLDSMTDDDDTKQTDDSEMKDDEFADDDDEKTNTKAKNDKKDKDVDSDEEADEN